MPDVIPTSDIIVATGPAIGPSTVPAIADGDRLIINSGIDILATAGDAVVADFATLDVEVDGTVAGGDGGFFLNGAGSSSPLTYAFDIGLTGVITGNALQGIFAGSTAIGNPTLGSSISVLNAGSVSSMSSDGVRLQNAELISLNNSGTINSFSTGSFFASAVTIAQADAVNVTNTGVIENFTTVVATGDDLGDIAALSFRLPVDNVTLNNSGTITGQSIGVFSQALVSENIVNSGTINGQLYLSEFVGGTFENTVDGVINGTLRTFGGDDVVVNNGDINASVVLGDGNDRYSGTAVISGTVNGGGGDDVIFGSNGADTIVGRSGSDELRGREGADDINGDAGDDFVAGGGGDDFLRGGSGNDILSGASGNDILRGGSGADEVGGGAGDDDIRGARGNDELIGGDGNDFVGGGGGNDILYGRDGEDTLRGSDGNDTLIGGNGVDLLVGGSGSDMFVWLDVTDSGTTTPTADIVRDFGDGADLLDISALSDDDFTFVNSGGFTASGNAEVRVSVSSGGDSYVRLDVDGDGDWDMQFVVEDTTNLTAGDFIL